MPIFEYVCKDCGAAFELLIRGESDRESAACPRCGSRQMDKQFSVFGMSGVESRGGGGGSSCSTCTSGSCSTCR
ncbi:MAG TPA: zinc ribbon domain-containing protein [Firmicutes bacterium]|nr:zinc ribbon domain-containing protein [Bacillota bacterium]